MEPPADYQRAYLAVEEALSSLEGGVAADVILDVLASFVVGVANCSPYARDRLEKHFHETLRVQLAAHDEARAH